MLTSVLSFSVRRAIFHYLTNISVNWAATLTAFVLSTLFSLLVFYVRFHHGIAIKRFVCRYLYDLERFPKNVERWDYLNKQMAIQYPDSYKYRQHVTFVFVAIFALFAILPLMPTTSMRFFVDNVMLVLLVFMFYYTKKYNYGLRHTVISPEYELLESAPYRAYRNARMAFSSWIDSLFNAAFPHRRSASGSGHVTTAQAAHSPGRMRYVFIFGAVATAGICID